MQNTAFLLLLLPGLAFGSTVAVMPIEAPGQEAAGQSVMRALRAAVVAGGDADKGEVKLNVPEARISFSCFDESAACMSQVGAILEAEQLIWGKLSQDSGRWTLALNRIDVGSTQVIRAETFVWPARAESVATLEAAAQAFVQGRPMPRPAPIAPAKTRVTFMSEPSGAVVFVDEGRMGTTPVEVDLVLGDYRVEMRHEDAPEAVRESITVGEAPQTVRLVFPAAPVDVPKPTPGRDNTHLWIGVGTGVLALGAAGLATVKGLEVLELRDDGEAARLAGDIPRHRDLEAQHDDAQLLANIAWPVAVVGAGVSGYFFYRHFSQGEVAVTPTGTGLAVSGSF